VCVEVFVVFVEARVRLAVGTVTMDMGLSGFLRLAQVLQKGLNFKDFSE
jgi:hypothetical protein